MKKSDLLKELETIGDDEKIEFYIWDYEYDDENPYDVGSGEFTGIDKGLDCRYINIGIHK